MKKLIIVLLVMFFLLCTCVAIGSAETGTESTETESTVETEIAPEVEIIIETEAEMVVGQEVEIGEDKDHPFIITANELAEEINADKAATKEKYNGKWVQITGEITDTSNGGVSYGYYLYGKSALTGYSGLRIMCWCDDGPFLQVSTGDTETFVGQVLEITTVNATEIINCERVK